MLQAMNTGHEGSLATVHANSTDDALSRLETLSAMSDVELPFAAVHDQVNAAVDLVVQLLRTADGTRRTVAVDYLTSRRREDFRLARVMHFDARGGPERPRRVRAPPRARGRWPRSSRLRRTSRCPRASRSPQTADGPTTWAGASRGPPDRRAAQHRAIALLRRRAARPRVRSGGPAPGAWARSSTTAAAPRRTGSQRAGAGPSSGPGWAAGCERQLLLAGVRTVPAAACCSPGRRRAGAVARVLWRAVRPGLRRARAGAGRPSCCAPGCGAARTAAGRRSSPRCPSSPGCWPTRPTPGLSIADRDRHRRRRAGRAGPRGAAAGVDQPHLRQRHRDALNRGPRAACPRARWASSCRPCWSAPAPAARW